MSDDPASENIHVSIPQPVAEMSAQDSARWLHSKWHLTMPRCQARSQVGARRRRMVSSSASSARDNSLLSAAGHRSAIDNSNVALRESTPALASASEGSSTPLSTITAFGWSKRNDA